MKKMNFKKIATMGLAAIMGMSAMSISAFAKQEIPLEDGAKLVIYEDGDEIPMLFNVRTANFSFDQTFAKYSS